MGQYGFQRRVPGRITRVVCMLVKAQGRLGEHIRTSRGTKQGSELSPLIFGLFIERLRPLIALSCLGMGPLVGALQVPEVLYADR